MTLETFFHTHPKAALAFSGGCDSALLLWAAKEYGCQLRAYFVDSPFQPRCELEDARRLAEQLDMPLTVLQTNPLSNPLIASNPADRCYHCKKAIFGSILEAARKDGYGLVLDGTNASDNAQDRPGMRALTELSVRSPLRECGLTKAQVRALSKEAGLFTWDKPAYACLATRVPTGTPLEPETLQRVEQGEAFLAQQGFSDFRIRVRGGLALIQLPQDQMEQAFRQRLVLSQGLSPWFQEIALDLAGRI